MSNTDSFIDEVSEEVRRDKLFAVLKRWGWVGVLAVLLIVGGAAYNEYRKADERARAEAAGNAMLTAMEAKTPEARVAALDAIPAEGAQTALLGLMEASAAVDTGTTIGEQPPEALAARQAAREKAIARLQALSTSGAVDEIYRELASLKLVMLSGSDMAVDQRLERLNTLSQPGAPFRILAMEQKALTLIEADRRDEALALLREMQTDPQLTAGLLRRVSQLIVALGGRVDAA